MFDQTTFAPASTSEEATGCEPRESILRKFPRQPVHIRALLYKGETFQPTLLQDLSRGGAGLQGATGIVPGDKISIQFLDGRVVTGEIKWWLAGNCGAAFDTQLAEDDPLFKKARRRIQTA